MITITGTNRSELIIGSRLNEKFYDLGGSDVVMGNAGNDVFYSSVGNDYLLGGSGRDTFFLEFGDTPRMAVVDGGRGIDVVNISTDMDYSVEFFRDRAVVTFSDDDSAFDGNLVLFDVEKVTFSDTLL